MTETTAKDRIKMFLSYLGIGQKKFETTVGLSNGYINSLRKAPSADKIKMIINAYPQLNMDWLITGEGEMLNSYKMEPNITSVNELSSMSVPLYNINAVAGIKSGQTDGEEIEDMVPWIDAREGDFAVRVKGDSMEPRIHDGAYVLLRPCVADPHELAYGHIHLVVTEDRVALKIIRADSDNAHVLRLVSINEAYPPFSVPFEDIRHIYRAVSTLSML